MRTIEIPGIGRMDLEDLVLDVNGTLSHRGRLIDGVAERIRLLSADLTPHLLTADTFGTAGELGARLGVAVTTVANGADKAAFVAALGTDGAVAVGNGRNDEAMLQAARIGIAIVGPEGAAAAALRAADIVCRSVTEALDLLVDDRLLVATLRP